MELLFITLGGAILGLAARYVVPRREFHGVLLVPAVGAGTAAVVWVALTWLGLAWDGGWIWLVSLVLSGAAAAGAAYVVGRRREQDDVRTYERLARFGLARG
ncbi:hypothetical protein GCM10009819_09510 [Agromyces tropicus]|uniref:Integral membrane protein n=1 Tax=Agromyces tropicus TaxID=555371 RepID=A0ABP5FJZ9_9MICO